MHLFFPYDKLQYHTLWRDGAGEGDSLTIHLLVHLGWVAWPKHVRLGKNTVMIPFSSFITKPLVKSLGSFEKAC